MTLTDWLAKVRGRIEKATPGPWAKHKRFRAKYWQVLHPHMSSIAPPWASPSRATFGKTATATFDECDAEFIAHSRTDLEKAVRVIEVLLNAVVAPNPECAACSGSGRYEVGTGYADSYGAEVTDLVECGCMVSREALAEADRIVGGELK